jgi:2-oxoglutarate dehydrogenase complex, dehydrogenase (E1) component, and related enzymes
MKNIGAVVLLGALILPPAAHADVVSDVLGCEGDPCVVSFNPGGEIGSFKAAAREIKRSGRRVVIDGPCLSACAILADQARNRVCVTSKARFGFHKGYELRRASAGGPIRLVRRFNPSHSADIAGWVSKRGGYPSRGFRVMQAGDAKRIWRGC